MRGCLVEFESEVVGPGLCGASLCPGTTSGPGEVSTTKRVGPLPLSSISFNSFPEPTRYSRGGTDLTGTAAIA